MRAMDRLSDVADSMRERRLRMRNENLDEENRRIRGEVRALREELEHERDARSRMLDALERVKAEPTEVRKRGGVLRLIVVGGAAYVLGAKAGRERYEAIRRWWTEMRERVSQGREQEQGSPVRELSA